MQILILSFLLSALAGASFGAECNGAPNPNAQPNLNAIVTDEPVFVRSVPNALLYTVGTGDDMINLVHLYGSPYAMGFAHATLLQSTMLEFMNGVWAYLELQVAEALNATGKSILKPWFVKLVADKGLDWALNLTCAATRPWTGEYFFQELQGMADALPTFQGGYQRILYIHMLGELTKGSCSMYGAWGAATASTGSPLLQLRALDWDVDGPFKNFPQITVYHILPSDDNGHSFANIGWTGWIGSITGISSSQMAISEIGVSFPDASFGKESREGVPFTFILRDILQFDQDLEAAEEHLTSAKRTCYLLFGVGDGKTKEFRGVQYSSSVANFYTDTNLQPLESWHPRITDIVYWGMDWLCPGYSTVLARQLNAAYGKITPEVTISNITAIAQTGDLHVAIYDLTNMILYTANAKKDSASGPINAYDRTFLRLDMNAVFSVLPPSV